METQLTQDKNPAVNSEEQAPVAPPVDLPTNGPAATPLPPEKAVEPKPLPFSLTPQKIRFSNGNEAQWVYPPPNTPVEAIITALGLEKPEALMLITGTSAALSDEIQAHLVQLFSRSLARTAAEAKTIIIDEGRQTDLSNITGQGVADRDFKSIYLGVTDAHKVIHPDLPEGTDTSERARIEPHHSHLVLVPEGDRLSENELMARIAASLAEDKPVVTVLAQGGELAKAQVVQSVPRNHWPCQ